MRRNTRSWLTLTIASALLAYLLLFGTGCFTRTVYVPAGQPIRLRQDVRSVKVWVIDSNNKPVPGVMDLKEGWFCGALKKDGL